MSAPLQPSTLGELAEAVRSSPEVIAVGAGTKPNLSAVGVSGASLPISTRRLSGIVEYSPTEFTFTARAGTPLTEIIAVLAGQGQHLPFDPPQARAGATIGGTVASGFNGPGRLRFGGIRDFILGICFIDGAGRLLRMGGKVVKNAAGFDLPKFFVGSLGRFGVLGEITFKVFPKPAASRTLEWTVSGDREMSELLAEAAKGRWEVEALECDLCGSKVYARLSGPAGAVDGLAADMGRRWPAKLLPTEAANSLWEAVNDFSWAHPEGLLCKVPLTLAGLPGFAALGRGIPGARARVGAGGAVGHVSLPAGADIPGFDEGLRQRGLRGLAWRGTGALWLGVREDFRIHAAIKEALDPAGRFPRL